MNAITNIEALAVAQLPQSVQARMRAHYIDRVEKLLGGEHMHVWAPAAVGALYLASNDYLCLQQDMHLRQAQANCLLKGGQDLLMSSVFLQADSTQHRLEQRFADFLQSEAVILAQSGWAANVGLLQSLAGPDLPVYLDMLAHASLWEGAHAAGARAIGFLHNDVEHLMRQLNRHGPGVIVVDAVYSTNGAVAPLEALVCLAEASGSVLVVDESHSLGTHGPQGAGLVVAAGLQRRVHFRTASLAKAFAGRAGLISSTEYFKGYFLSESRPAIFSSCLLDHELAWFGAALEAIQAADAKRTRLLMVSQRCRRDLARLGYPVASGSEQIIALEAGPEPRTLLLRKALERRGIYGAVFCAPATAKNRSLVRLTLNSGISDWQLEQLTAACAEIRDEVALSLWRSRV